MDETDEEIVQAITKETIWCAIAVHNAFGPGLLESVYRKALVIGLRARGLKVEEKRRVPLTYLGVEVDYLEVDVFVERCVVVEVKSVTELAPIHSAQTVTYLKLTNAPAGLLINFNVKRLEDGIRRLDRPDLYHAKKAKMKPLLDTRHRQSFKPK
jgi:GxxExxY protein